MDKEPHARRDLLREARRLDGSIVRHAYYPGQDEAVDQSIDDLVLAGRITDEQRDVLREVLLGSFSHAA